MASLITDLASLKKLGRFPRKPYCHKKPLGFLQLPDGVIFFWPPGPGVRALNGIFQEKAAKEATRGAVEHGCSPPALTWGQIQHAWALLAVSHTEKRRPSLLIQP